MDLTQLPKTFDQMAAQNPYWAALTEKTTWNIEDFFESGRNHIEKVMRTANRLRPFPCGRALDFGCGPGRLAQALSERFSSVTGVDISESMLAKAREMNRYPGKCEYVLNRRQDLSLYPDRHFDFVHTTMVLQHMRPVLALSYIREFLRIVTDGGLVVFQVPEKPAPGIAGTILRFTPTPLLRPLRHVDMYGHSEATVRKVVEAAGGRILLKEASTDAGKRWIDWRYYAARS